MLTISIAKDFSESVGARYVSDGEFSGEEFHDKWLEPNFLKARENNQLLEVNFDGGYGYPTSFLEEAFGGLARKYGKESVLRVLRFVSEDEPGLLDTVNEYINEA